jgi:hypothetical protein
MPEFTNDSRAERAAKTLRFYMELVDGEVDQESLPDLLTDLLHMLKAEGVEDPIDHMYNVLADANENYRYEVEYEQ